ncbi:DUF4381 domain-containing protein [Methylobacterium haplocladii]|uniref:DUF4381 domain-containing protein n=1 Tax=Methylobacterium haplocladii TaxID=1176176 RepID=A0A512IM34_9HYPH|nr:DUF4381 domain-containing protein [Methylobacterium haplocladii]GEO98780.1 hypothetical protein MHA02_11680 [Methylobacterium haplocladii]GJD85043.1 hypothetical protein HPGCJGGD_2929 [Methylobacterium haplocladii]GLS61365.1 hypothetical protein GCM10007887_40730 [Methylobacterium haplocladii]
MNPELSTLRGLHLPAGGSSVLQGEIVAAIALGFAAALLFGLARILLARRRSTVRRAALHELTRARNLDPQTRLTAQARLLRRIVRTLEGEEAASARGTAWAQKLDGTFATDFFSRGAGRAFVDGLYRRPAAADPAAIDTELGRLFSRIKA